MNNSNKKFYTAYKRDIEYLKLRKDTSQWEKVNKQVTGVRDYPILRVDGKLRVQIFPTGGTVPIQSEIATIWLADQRSYDSVQGYLIVLIEGITTVVTQDFSNHMVRWNETGYELVELEFVFQEKYTIILGESRIASTSKTVLT
jgi:hypothetical protein